MKQHNCTTCANWRKLVTNNEGALRSDLEGKARISSDGKTYIRGWDNSETLRLSCDPAQYVVTTGRLGGER